MTVLSSLTNRIFLTSAVLVALATAASISRVNTAVTQQAESELAQGLAEAATLVNEFTRAQFTDFVVKGQLIADLPVLKGAVATEDPPTVQPIAADYQRTIGADLFVVAGRDGRLLADTGRIRLTASTLEAVLADCRSSSDRTCFHDHPGGILHVTTIGIEPGLGTLVVGASLDRQFTRRITQATRSEVAFVAGERIVAWSLPTEPTAGFQLPSTGQGTFTLRIGAEEFVGRVEPLGGAGRVGSPAAVVLRSRTERLRFLATLRWQLAAAGAVAILVATLLAYLIARTVTRPLRALTSAMGEIASTGDLARQVAPLGRWDDEDVRSMASTFRQLTNALGRFQREAAQRDRLLSLGRLSAVIAHEVRNPLMIIKSATRNLRRAPSTDAPAVAASIDEEVERLNRVVTGVLDFAKPIVFERSAVDLAVLVRQAAQAVSTGEPQVPIAVEGCDSPLLVDTDGERVRGVLVNVLTNAAQAIREHAGSTEASQAGTAAPITVTLRRDRDRCHIEVVDQGPGIDAGDLGRVFDPFFTTRRGGSGLGLPIARNVIEGLRGTITIDGRPGQGTQVRIELPATPVTYKETT